MPHKNEHAHIWDIIKAAQLALSFIDQMSKDEFEHDLKTYYAVIAQLQIIGEATKRLSPEFCSVHPELPWRDMARMRDWLIHHYDRIDLSVLWDTLTQDLPSVLPKLKQLLPPQ